MAFSTCLDNLRYCKASCCKEVSFTVGTGYDKKNIPIVFCSNDRKKYYEYHGFTVLRNNRRGYDIIIPSKYPVVRKIISSRMDLLTFKAPCLQLGDDNLCIIHEEKPFVCTALNWDNYETANITLTKNCIFLKGKEGVSNGNV